MARFKEIADILKSPKALAVLAGAGAATQTEDAVPLVKRALPMAPAIARIYDIAQGQQ